MANDSKELERKSGRRPFAEYGRDVLYGDSRFSGQQVRRDDEAWAATVAMQYSNLAQLTRSVVPYEVSPTFLQQTYLLEENTHA